MNTGGDKRVIEKPINRPDERVLLSDRYGKPLVVAVHPKLGFDPNRIR